MYEIRFYLDISADDYLRFYQGVGPVVWAVSHDGRRVQFPANRLRPFVTYNGVQGEFALRFDSQHKFVDLQRIGDIPP